MHNLDDLIERYLNNTASEEERALLLEMIQSGQVEEDVKHRIAKELHTEIESNTIPDIEAQATSERIYRKILEARTPTVNDQMWIDREESAGRKPFRLWRYAASFALLATAGILLFTQYFRESNKSAAFVDKPSDNWLKIVNTCGTKQVVALKDGSTISLEPGGEIRYPEHFDGKREVYLSGEAFFEVAKDASRPFLVYTNEVTTRVLGTSFRVSADKNAEKIIVAVKTGKVSVFAKATVHGDKSKDVQEVTLTPNHQAVYSKRDRFVTRQIVEHPYILAPQPPIKNYYTNVQVVQLLKSLSTSYGVDIRYDEQALTGCTLTSDIMEEEGLYEQLEIICHALGGQYAMDGASIVIEANGCSHNNVKP